MIGRISIEKWSIIRSIFTLTTYRTVACGYQAEYSRYQYHSFFRIKMEPNLEVYIRMKDAEQFSLSFLYFVPDLRISKPLTFTRSLSEPVGTLLSRLSIKINGAVDNKQKKKKKKTPSPEVVSEPVSLCLLKNGHVVSNHVLSKELFDEDTDVLLQIGDLKYKIVKNHPWIQNVALPKSMMASFPVYPVKLESYYTNESDSQFLWYRLNAESDEFVSSGIIYVPTTKDIGHKLKLVCIPKRNDVSGTPAEVLSTCEVEAGPGFCPFEMRHVFTQSPLAGDFFRVVSYNILADTYASSETGKRELFSYCPPYALRMDYRKQLIIKELTGYNADIVCLQEVDCRIFEVDLKRCLENIGLVGEFAKKGGQVSEGVACFYRKSRLKLIMKNKLTLGEDSCQLSYLSHIWNAVKQNHSLYANLKERTTAAQILLFDYVEKPNHKLIVANTHLYFHPQADHIRLLQAGICLSYINNMVNELKREDCHSNISVIFGGDFNSTPDGGVYKLFTSGHVPDCYHEWKCDDSVENVSGLSLHNPISFRSACGTPEFTNFTPNFSACLDYIFYQCDNLTLKQVIPFPLKEDVVKNIAIPSVVFPSDHVALVADLAWK